MAMFHLAMAQKWGIEWNASNYSHPKGLHPILLGSLSWAQTSTRASSSLTRETLMEYSQLNLLVM